MSASVDHVVVLALENRSFDHMLGYLPHPDPSFEGLLDSGPYTNPGWNGGAPVAASPDAKTVLPVCPDHSHDAATEQLGLTSRISGTRPTNEGFVTSYERVCRGLAPPKFGGLLGPIIDWWKSRNPPAAPAPNRGPLVMNCQGPAQVPVLSQVALGFEVCTHWFCSVPGETWPNRNFMHSATSDGETDIDPRLYTNKTIFEVLEAAGRDWHIYYDDTPQIWAFVNLWDTPQRHAKWFEFEAFDRHCQAGTLPAYSFIEPNHRPGFHLMDAPSPGLSNNQHPGNNIVANKDYDAAPPAPPGDFVRAEALIASVYESLRANRALFERTVLLVTYDEHGGLYEHVPPPTGVPNPGQDPTPLRRVLRAIYHRRTAAFDFSVLGPRVPTLVISPYVAAGHVNQQIRDHASICSTLRALFAPATPPLTSRDGWARPFHLDLTLETPRTDLPDLSAYAGRPPVSPPGDTTTVPVGPASTVPDHYQPYVELADNVRRRLAARGVSEAAHIPGMPPLARAAQATAAFHAEAQRCRDQTLT